MRGLAARRQGSSGYSGKGSKYIVPGGIGLRGLDYTGLLLLNAQSWPSQCTFALALSPNLPHIHLYREETAIISPLNHSSEGPRPQQTSYFVLVTQLFSNPILEMRRFSPLFGVRGHRTAVG